LKVALVYESFTLGDSLGRQRVFLARALVRQGVEVHFYGGVGPETADVPGVTCHPLPRVAARPYLRHSLEYLRFGIAATRAVRRDRRLYDVVDVSGTTAWEHDVVCVHAITVAEQRRWPARGGRFHRAAGLRARLAPLRSPKIAVARSVERLQYRPGRFQLALPVTEEVRDDLLAVHGVPAERALVVPYPIDYERLTAAERGGLRTPLGLAPDVPLLLFVGHGFERKGLAETLAALAEIDAGVHLAIVGGGDVNAYGRMAGDLGIGGRVHFLGSTAAPEELYPDADVLVLPTREDVWGIAIVEAMAAGVPVVTSDTAGARAAVEEAGAGTIVPTGDVRSLRQAVAALVANPDRRAELGRRGRAAAARYGLDAFGATMVSCYEQAVRLRESSVLPSRRDPGDVRRGAR
jgi:UDP-glucose:(heptosyl)LPS alpha-1,3-glucosyltransferase